MLLLFTCCCFVVIHLFWVAKPDLKLFWQQDLNWLDYEAMYSFTDSTWCDYSYVLLQRYRSSADGDITLLYSILLSYFSKTQAILNSKAHLVLNVFVERLWSHKSHRIKWWNGLNQDEINSLISGRQLNKNWTRMNSRWCFF